MANVEKVMAGEKTIAIIVPGGHHPLSTEFVTTPELNLQVGLIRYPAGGAVQPHAHRALERHVVGTGEVLFVRSGRAELSLYDDQRRLLARRTLQAGDLVFLVSGGHGLKMLEDTLLVEVKQGPYTGLDEKERFTP